MVSPSGAREEEIAGSNPARGFIFTVVVMLVLGVSRIFTRFLYSCEYGGLGGLLFTAPKRVLLTGLAGYYVWVSSLVCLFWCFGARFFGAKLIFTKSVSTMGIICCTFRLVFLRARID